MQTVDPAIVEALKGLSEKDYETWMRELRKQQTFRTRTVPQRVITVRRIDAKYIHETTVWPTQWQPFIPWVHEETDYMGERDMRGTVRDAKDAQRVYNVNVSSLSEAVNDAPKNRVVGYKGQFGKPDSLTRRGWETAPNKRFAFLEVEAVTIADKPAPFPQPFNVEPAIMGLAHAIAQADNDLKSTGRFHDASLVQSSPGRPSSPGSGRTNSATVGSLTAISSGWRRCVGISLNSTGCCTRRRRWCASPATTTRSGRS